MPLLTRWYIRTSFIYFILALLLGAILGTQALGYLDTPSLSLYPTYLHLLTEGWITMLIIGVAFWMFPKYTPEQPRRSLRLGWASFLLLNAGLLLRLLSEPVIGAPRRQLPAWAALLILAAILQWLGGMAFVVNTWARVKEK